MLLKSKEIHLIDYPVGLPSKETFRLVDLEVPAPAKGEVTVRNHFMSVDPYMRGRMSGQESYVEPFKTGEVMIGGAVGEIIESAHPDYNAGDMVLSMRGWREAFTAPVDQLQAETFRKIDTAMIPAQSYLGVAGMPGLTAYAGLYDVAKFTPSDTVLVSGAAGAVGSIVCQLAKADGAYVVGIAGSDSKCEWLKSRGVDAVINYKTTPDMTKALLQAAPQGIDVYFENVGGGILQAALNSMNTFGRIAVCGMISAYNDAEPQPGPNNLIQIVGKSLKIQGFIVSNHAHVMPDFIAKLGPALMSGQITAQETIMDGIENASTAFLRLFSGDKQGKMLVKLS